MTGSRWVPSRNVNARSRTVAAVAVACVLAACGAGAAPVARSASLEVPENGVLSVAFPVDASPVSSLTFAIVEPPSHGTVDVDPASRAFRYRPEPYFSGQDAFVFTVSDASRTSAPATISVVVTPVNFRPSAMGVGSTDFGTVMGENVIEVPEDTTVTGRLAAADPDEDGLTFEVLSPPANGLLSVYSPTGSFVYQPLSNWNGTDGFVFTVWDGSLYSEPARVTIIVTPVNDPPVAATQTVLLDEDTSIAGQLSASDVESSTLTYLLTSPPLHGAVEVNAATGAFTYAPGADYYGPDSFRFTASDGELSSQEATVDIIVRPVPTVPTISVPPFVIAGRAGYVASVVPVPGDTVSWSIVGGDLTSTDVSASGATGTSVAFAAGSLPTVALTAVATRGGVVSQPATVVVPVASPPVVPVEKSLALTAIPGAPLDLGLPDLRSSTAMSVSVTNLSDAPLLNPQVFAENRPAPYAFEDILLALPQSATDRELAEAAWRYVRDRFFHYCSGGSSDPDPTDDFYTAVFTVVNGFGFGCCNQTASYLAAIWAELGLASRVPYMPFHTVAEVFYDGAWHMYDPDHRTFYLKRDGVTVASVEEVLADPELVALAGDDQGRDPSGWLSSTMAGLYAETTSVGYWPAPGVGLVPVLPLMPKETFTVFHANQTGAATRNSSFDDTFDTSNVTSGVLTLHFSAEEQTLSRQDVATNNIQLSRSADVHAFLQASGSSAGSIAFSRSSPFPLLDVLVWVRLNGPTGLVTASFSVDGAWSAPVPVVPSRARAGYTHVADLSSVLRPRRQYDVRVDIDQGASVEAIGLESRVQVNRVNFPMFVQGPGPYDSREAAQTATALLYKDASPTGQARTVVAASRATAVDTQINGLELSRTVSVQGEPRTQVNASDLLVSPAAAAGPEENLFEYTFTLDQPQVVRQLRATLLSAAATTVSIPWKVQTRMSAEDSWHDHVSGVEDVAGRLEIDTFILARQVRFSGAASTPVRFVNLALFGEP